MIEITNLVIGDEYYFHFQNFYCTGFIIEVKENSVRIKNGCYFFNKDIYAYHEATIDLTQIVSYASA